MKQFLSSMADKAKQLLSSMRDRVKPFLTSLADRAKNILSTKFSNVKLPLSPKLCKLLVLIFVLLLALVIGLTRCSADKMPSDEMNTGIVSIDSLDVHKKPHAGSRVLGQLPMDVEVEILESKTGKETIWGRIDSVKLPDGTKIKGGWIDLLFVDFEDDVAW